MPEGQPQYDKFDHLPFPMMNISGEPPEGWEPIAGVSVFLGTDGGDNFGMLLHLTGPDFDVPEAYDLLRLAAEGIRRSIAASN